MIHEAIKLYVNEGWDNQNAWIEEDYMLMTSIKFFDNKLTSIHSANWSISIKIFKTPK
jgi:hypothetical protein